MRNFTFKQFIKISLYIALAITIGQAIITMPGLSAGAWMVTLAPVAFFAVLLLLQQIEALPQQWNGWISTFKLPGKRDLSIKFVLAIIQKSKFCRTSNNYAAAPCAIKYASINCINSPSRTKSGCGDSTSVR